jgi:hypothetical protein
MFSFALDYYLLVAISVFGVIQIAASLGRLDALLLFRSALATWAFGVGLAAAAFVWFFATGERNINDYEGGLNANVQSLLFFLGASSAYAAALGFSSIVNARMEGAGPGPGEGLGALRRTTFARAVSRSLRYWWREWRTQIRPYLFG